MAEVEEGQIANDLEANPLGSRPTSGSEQPTGSRPGTSSNKTTTSRPSSSKNDSSSTASRFVERESIPKSFALTVHFMVFTFLGPQVIVMPMLGTSKKTHLLPRIVLLEILKL